MAVKVAGNVTVSFNANALAAYLNTASMAATVAAIDVTDFASTASEFLTGFAEWSIPIGGHWDATLDGYLAPEAVTPGTARTTIIVFTDATPTAITYTWTSNSFIENYQIDASSPTEGITWSATLRLSGAPVRS